MCKKHPPGWARLQVSGYCMEPGDARHRRAGLESLGAATVGTHGSCIPKRGGLTSGPTEAKQWAEEQLSLKVMRPSSAMLLCAPALSPLGSLWSSLPRIPGTKDVWRWNGHGLIPRLLWFSHVDVFFSFTEHHGTGLASGSSV